MEDHIYDVAIEPTASRTSDPQKKLLVTTIYQCPALHSDSYKTATGKVQYKKVWEDLADSLNALPGPKRSTCRWQKVWCDIKRHVKEKAAKLKTGAPLVPPLLPLEEVILKIIRAGSEGEDDDFEAKPSPEVQYMGTPTAMASARPFLTGDSVRPISVRLVSESSGQTESPTTEVTRDNSAEIVISNSLSLHKEEQVDSSALQRQQRVLKRRNLRRPFRRNFARRVNARHTQLLEEQNAILREQNKLLQEQNSILRTHTDMIVASLREISRGITAVRTNPLKTEIL